MERRFLQMLPAVGYKAYYLDEEFNLLTAPVVCWTICAYYCEEHDEEYTTIEPCVNCSDFAGLIPADSEFQYLVGVYEDGVSPDFLNEKIEELKERLKHEQCEHPSLSSEGHNLKVN